MKKTLAIFLTVVFVLGLSAVAFADTTKKVLEPITTAVANAVSSDPTMAQNDNKDQKVHDATVTMNASKLEVALGEKVTITATTKKQGSSFTDNWTTATQVGKTSLDSEGNYVSTAEFSSNTSGQYTVTYKIEMDAGNNTDKFVGEKSVTITVLGEQPTEGKVVSFEISAANVNNQDYGNDKDALYITALKVTYDNGTTKTVEGLNIKIGNIYSKPNRMFDVTYEGVTSQFEAAKVLSKLGLPAYTPTTTTTTPEKSKQPDKPQTPVKPEKPDKPAKQS